LQWLATDEAVKSDPGFAPTFQKYAASTEAFFEDYKKCHAQLSEQGSYFTPEGGIRLADITPDGVNSEEAETRDKAILEGLKNKWVGPMGRAMVPSPLSDKQRSFADERVRFMVIQRFKAMEHLEKRRRQKQAYRILPWHFLITVAYFFILKGSCAQRSAARW